MSVKDTINKAKDAIKNKVDDIKQKVNDVKDKVVDVANKVVDKVKDALTPPKEVPGVMMYQQDPSNLVTGKKDNTKDYGHYWTEVGSNESYGWWPEKQVDIKETLNGVKGDLNGQTSFGGTPTKDPYHGYRSSNVREYKVYSKDNPADVMNGIRNFANSYSGDWKWPGPTCQTFQKEMVKELKLKIKQVK